MTLLSQKATRKYRKLCKSRLFNLIQKKPANQDTQTTCFSPPNTFDFPSETIRNPQTAHVWAATPCRLNDANCIFRETALWKRHVLLKHRHIYQTTRCHIQEDRNLHSLRIEKVDFQTETSFWIQEFLPGVSCCKLLAQKASFHYFPAPVSEITGLSGSYNIKLELVFSVSHKRETLSSVTFNDVVN